METIRVGENRFFMGETENSLAEILYQPEDGGIIITHTYVSQVLRGRGIGRLLVLKVVDLARKTGQKIIPLCSFAKGVLEGNDEFADVLIRG